MARNDYKWNTNSRDERQSDYAQSGYSTISDASQDGGAKRRALRNRRARLNLLLRACAIVIAASVAVLYGVSHYLRG
jgi:hypothetical protein